MTTRNEINCVDFGGYVPMANYHSAQVINCDSRAKTDEMIKCCCIEDLAPVTRSSQVGAKLLYWSFGFSEPACYLNATS